MIELFKYEEEYIVVHTPTERDYDYVIKCCLDLGFMWCSTSTKICHHHWLRYMSQTCIGLEEDIQTLSYGSYEHYSSCNIGILKVREFYDKVKYYKTFKELI